MSTDRVVLDRVVWTRWHESEQNDLHGELATNTFLSAVFLLINIFFFFFLFFPLFSADYKTVASLARHPPPLCGNNTMEMQCIFHAGKSRTAGTKPDIGQSCNETRHCLPRKTKARSVAPSPACLKFQNIPNISRKLCCSFEKLSRLLSFIPRLFVINEIGLAKFLFFSFFFSFPLLLQNLRKFEYTYRLFSNNFLY